MVSITISIVVKIISFYLGTPPFYIVFILLCTFCTLNKYIIALINYFIKKNILDIDDGVKYTQYIVEINIFILNYLNCLKKKESRKDKNKLGTQKEKR